MKRLLELMLALPTIVVLTSSILMGCTDVLTANKVDAVIFTVVSGIIVIILYRTITKLPKWKSVRYYILSSNYVPDLDETSHFYWYLVDDLMSKYNLTSHQAQACIQCVQDEEWYQQQDFLK